MSSRSSPESEGQEPKPLSIYRTHLIYRPLTKIVTLAKKVIARPRTIGVGGVVFGFVALITIGTILLSLPAAREPGTSWSLINSLFTATSAVCLTGLVVVDTGTYWSLFGQGVILGLIQMGGLGVMTASMLILVILRRPISFTDRLEIHETTHFAKISSVGRLISLTLLITIIIEALGAFALWLQLGSLKSGEELLWSSIFHSVSAFNNAGFDIMKNYSSLTYFSANPAFLMTIALLVITGGLGVLVLLDALGRLLRGTFSTNSKIVLGISALLLAFGFLAIFAAEFSNAETLGVLSLPNKLTNAFFASVAARTAGFNAISIKDLHEQTGFLLMVLMFIGGATGSTAGGIKVNTFAVLALATWAAIRGYDHTSAFGYRLSHRLVYRALAVATLSMVAVFTGTVALTITEGFPFRQILFEVFSGLGTVGLTTGITPYLSTPGKFIVITLMFLGRLGPLTLAYALAQHAREPRYELPEGDISIG